jgi:predicted Zn finger-like uncharacterized protein
MKIECPNCQLTGQISDAKIPPEGQYMECPRCKASIFMQKSSLSSLIDTLTDCPECSYSTFSDERFDICPQCGLDAKTYRNKRKQPGSRRNEVRTAEEPVVVDKERIRQDLERLQLEEEKKQRMHSAEKLILPPTELPEPEALVIPAPVRYLGWAFVVVGILVLMGGSKAFYEACSIIPSDTATMVNEAPPGPFKFFLAHKLLPTLQVALGIYMALAGSQFLKMRPWARKGLEVAAWSGIIYVVVSEAVNLIALILRSSWSASFLYYFLGIADMLFMVAILSAPLLAAIWYLRGETFDEAFDTESQ